MHTSQPAAPEKDIFPALHVRQVPWPTRGCAVPESQSVQVAEPATGACFPIGHATHDNRLLLETLPIGQTRHPAAPGLLEYLPEGH